MPESLFGSLVAAMGDQVLPSSEDQDSAMTLAVLRKRAWSFGPEWGMGAGGSWVGWGRIWLPQPCRLPPALRCHLRGWACGSRFGRCRWRVQDGRGGRRFPVLLPETMVPSGSWIGLSFTGPIRPSARRVGLDQVWPLSAAGLEFAPPERGRGADFVEQIQGAILGLEEHGVPGGDAGHGFAIGAVDGFIEDAASAT